ncbi:MAG TPA: hypothetical protein VK975_07575 [Acidimicrobiales bacterium]|nr:hypothetical protein [Acidimicrobiales bacterium]
MVPRSQLAGGGRYLLAGGAVVICLTFPVAGAPATGVLLEGELPELVAALRAGEDGPPTPATLTPPAAVVAPLVDAGV